MQDVFITATNIKNFGHLINDEFFNTDIAHPDFDQIFTNKFDWEIRYIHHDYHNQLDDTYTQSQVGFSFSTTRLNEIYILYSPSHVLMSFGSRSQPKNSVMN